MGARTKSRYLDINFVGQLEVVTMGRPGLFGLWIRGRKQMVRSAGGVDDEVRGRERKWGEEIKSWMVMKTVCF